MVITSDRNDLPLHAPINALADLAQLHPAVVQHAINHHPHNLTPIQQYAVPIGLDTRDLIAVTQERDSGWWLGAQWLEPTRRGFFPCTYVERVPNSHRPSTHEAGD